MATQSTALLTGVVSPFAVGGGSAASVIASQSVSQKIRLRFHSYRGEEAPGLKPILSAASSLIEAVSFRKRNAGHRRDDGGYERARHAAQAAASNNTGPDKDHVADALRLNMARPDSFYRFELSPSPWNSASKAPRKPEYEN